MLVESLLLKVLGALRHWTRSTQAQATISGTHDSNSSASPNSVTIGAGSRHFSSLREPFIAAIQARGPEAGTESVPPAGVSLTDSIVSTTFTYVSATAAADSSCSPQPYDVAPIPLPSLPARDPALATVYRYRRQAGVNLGSWFLLEGWMVPSLFSSDPAISEFDIASGWNGQAKAVLERHWDSFITEDDFEWLSSIGINTVRLPIGYWHVGANQDEWNVGTAYEPLRVHYAGAWPRILRAVSWAANHGIGVIVDLHGAPGSQNGQHHSGVSDGQTGLFNSPDNIKKTISLLEYLTTTFVNVPNVVGIQLLNEPLNVPELYDFYHTALDSLRSLSPDAKVFPFYLHDAFNIHQGADFVRSRGSEWTVLDHHSYFVFTPDDNAKPASVHSTDISSSGNLGAEMIHVGKNLNGNLITGEWSCALSTMSLEVEADPGSARRAFCETQKQTYADAGSGYHFWSYKKENCDQDPSWCFRNAVGNALASTFFSYDGQTSPQNLYLAVGAELAAPVAQPGFPASWTTPASSSSTMVSNVAATNISNKQDDEGSVPENMHLQDNGTDSRSPALPRSSFEYTEDIYPTRKVHQVSRWHSRDHRAHKIHERRAKHRMRRNDDAPESTDATTSEGITSTIQDTSIESTLSSSSEPSMATNSQTILSGNSPLSPAHQAIQRGFSDGFMTAKLFAQHGPGMSRLGFKWQYVEDSLRAHGSSIIVPGKEGYYREWFDKGLVQGEAMVEQVIARMNSAR